MLDRDRTAVGQEHISPEPHVLVRRRGIPVDPHDRKIVRLGSGDFDCERIGPGGADVSRDLEPVAAERTHDLVRSGDPHAVDPDVRAVVDPVEVDPESPGCTIRWKGELGAVPPRGLERTVGWCRQKREALADGIGRPRNPSQVHPEVGIGVLPVLHQGADHGVWNRDLVPAAHIEPGLRDRSPRCGDLSRWPDGPAVP
jgi:hypothetical protein